MKTWTLLLSSALAIALVGCASKAEEPAAPEGETTSSVNTEMKVASMTAAQAPAFTLKTAKGETHSLKSLTATNDLVVLYFIGHTCPTNSAAIKYIHQIANQKHDKVAFVGIINTDKAGFEKWNAKNKAQYPVLLDADLKTIRAYKAERSPWFIMVNKSGEIVQTDKGYSEGSLRETNAKLAKVEGHAAKALDLKGASANMTYG